MIEAQDSNVSRRRLLKGAALLGFAGAALPRRGWASEDKQLNFYNWDTYTGETTLSTFTERTGIEVSLDLYASNEELFAKLSQGNSGYALRGAYEDALADGRAPVDYVPRRPREHYPGPRRVTVQRGRAFR